MALRYIYNGVAYDMSPFADPPGGKARLNIINGTKTERYGFTSDVTASQYAPMKYMINGKVAYLGRTSSSSSSSSAESTRPSDNYQTSSRQWHETRTTYYTTSSTTNATTSTSTTSYRTYETSTSAPYNTYIATGTMNDYKSFYVYTGSMQTTYPFTGQISLEGDPYASMGVHTVRYSNTISRTTNTVSSVSLAMSTRPSAQTINEWNQYDGLTRGRRTLMNIYSTENLYRTDAIWGSSSSKSWYTLQDLNATRSTSTNTTMNTYRYNGDYFSSQLVVGNASRPSWYYTTSVSRYTVSNETTISTHNYNM